MGRTTGIIFIVSLIIFGCSTSGTIKFSEDDSQLVVRKFLKDTLIEVKDSQNSIDSSRLNARDIYDHYHLSAPTTFAYKASVYLEPCKNEKYFWRDAKSLISIVTLTIYPLENVYSCTTSMEITNLESKEIKSFNVEQRYVESFGVLKVINYFSYYFISEKRIKTVYYLLSMDQVAKSFKQ